VVFPALGFPGADSYLINPGMLQQQHGQKPAIPILKVLYLTSHWGIFFFNLIISLHSLSFFFIFNIFALS